MTRTILLIDDDPQLLRLLERRFEGGGWVVLRAETGERALELFERERPELVLQDLQLPGVGGLELLEALRRRDPDAAIVVLTGNGDVSVAVRAMHLGAENFLVKPVDFGHLEAVAERALEKVQLRRQNQALAERQLDGAEIGALGESPAMQGIARQIELIASTDGTVLLQGETGTGKGWVTRLVHSLSPRSSRPFVEVNCASLTATFLDSELFGHEKGAFTDAKVQKRGLFEVADGGTLFLDEIGDLAPELQPKLLKVLETRKFRRLGGVRENEVDVRLIAATNRPLEDDVRAGQFREDLYYRLAVFPVRLPPLRERSRADLVQLAYGLLHELRAKVGRSPERISADALAILCDYRWPGNIRELRNVLERAVLVANGAEEILPAHLPAELTATAAARPAGGLDPTLSLAEVERRHIAAVLEHCQGNRTQAARTLGISRRGLYDKLERYSLS